MAPGLVWAVEVAAGVVVAASFAYALVRLRRGRTPVPAQGPLASD
jgi:hypothetical protein